MDLQYQQVEAYLLNSTYWNYDFYNTVDQNDNWNLENFSLLGPERKPRHIDIVTRPYPEYSCAEPHLLFFDLKSKYCVIVLKGLAVEAPTLFIFHTRFTIIKRSRYGLQAIILNGIVKIK